MIWERDDVCCVWAGASDFETEGSFIWVASGRDIGMYFSSWKIDKPDGGDQENCLEIWSEAPDTPIYWNDNRCSTPINYICMF